MKELNQSISCIKGVGPKIMALLSKMGIETVLDMLYFFPRYVEDRRENKDLYLIKNGENVCITAKVLSSVSELRTRNKMSLYTLILQTDTEIIEAVWFNNKYIKSIFTVGDEYTFFGKLEKKFGKWQLVNPTFEKAGNNIHTSAVVPIYQLTANLNQKTIRQIAKNCVELTKGQLKEYLPAEIKEKYSLCEINFAISSIHFPKDMESYNTAKNRLIFEELFFLQLGLLYLREGGNSLKGNPFKTAELYEKFTKKLPFNLTNGQKTVILEIENDIKGNRPMSRLVQGDVGSGKTVIAFFCIYAALQNGYQAAFLAPTETLARQHYNNALKYFKEEDVVLLTGSVKGKIRKEETEKIQSGSGKVIIGTHAILEDNIVFENLGMVITDEQHRFGVRQRAKLVNKGNNPHLLVMSATPIPRTLALILYGDLDISVINELPPGRQRIETYVIDDAMKERIYNFMKKLILEGRQIYIICPLVEKSEVLDIKAAADLFETLSKNTFKEYNLRLLHGRMNAKDKSEAMQDFIMGKVNILISTTVIEVGIDVKNATLIMIENAERFGLAQLHQIRGRVGRGSEKSYCILHNGGGGKAAKERLSILAETSDGFIISKKDLELRGPGDFLGIRQHGLPELKIANMFSDAEALKNSQQAAKELIKKDSALIDYPAVRWRINEIFSAGIGSKLIN